MSNKKRTHLHSKKWMTGGEKEFVWLFQGFQPNEVEGVDVIDWLSKTSVPSNKIVSYLIYTIAVRPETDKDYYIRITVGGNWIKYEGDVSTTHIYLKQ